MNSDKCPCGREYKTVRPFNGDELGMVALKRCTASKPCWKISGIEELLLEFKERASEENKKLKNENASLKARIDELEEIESKYELLSTQLDSLDNIRTQLAKRKRRKVQPTATTAPRSSLFGNALIGFFGTPTPAFPQIVGGTERNEFGSPFTPFAAFGTFGKKD